MKKRKFLISMLAMTATLSLGALMGSCGMKDKINQWKCDHKEYKLVEVVEATCAEEGEKIMECVKCGKTVSEKIEKIAHTDEYGDGTCDICEEKVVELVEAENGEKAVGNTYRVFIPSNGSEPSAVRLSLVGDSISSMVFNFYDGKLQWKYTNADYLPFDVVETERYIEFTVQTGEGVVDDYSIEITEDCTISFSDLVNAHRVVPLE